MGKAAGAASESMPSLKRRKGLSFSNSACALAGGAFGADLTTGAEPTLQQDEWILNQKRVKKWLKGPWAQLHQQALPHLVPRSQAPFCQEVKEK